MKNPPIPQLTGIRFFLSLWVILYHLTVPNPLVVEIPGTINSFVYHGVRTVYSAVSLFFMISGFSLAYNYELDRPWYRQRYCESAFPEHWEALPSLRPAY